MTPEFGQVSGHYAGLFTRAAAFVIDWFVIITVFGLIGSVTRWVGDTMLGTQLDLTQQNWVWVVLFGLWAFLYLTVALLITGKTVGKALIGLKVVTRQGAPLSSGRASARVLTMPLSFLVLGLGLIGVVLGRERRALHDVIAGTAVVYDWGDRPAKMPAPMTRWLERRGVEVRPDATPGDEAAPAPDPEPTAAS